MRGQDLNSVPLFKIKEIIFHLIQVLLDMKFNILILNKIIKKFFFCLSKPFSKYRLGCRPIYALCLCFLPSPSPTASLSIAQDLCRHRSTQCPPPVVSLCKQKPFARISICWQQDNDFVMKGKFIFTKSHPLAVFFLHLPSPPYNVVIRLCSNWQQFRLDETEGEGFKDNATDRNRHQCQSHSISRTVAKINMVCKISQQ